ncbi:MAG: rhamnulokinase family protein [Frankiaceae bacterium]
MRNETFAAVDLGASSGRVMAARVGPEVLELTEVHRFGNNPVELADGLHWDIVGLYREVLDGLRRAGPVAGLAIDSWAVDYGLIGPGGALVGTPFCYRDRRTEAAVGRVQERLSAGELFAINGLQHLPFTTVYQLAAETLLEPAETLLLVPDLLGFWLTGRRVAELTNASTTGLLDAGTRTWSSTVFDALRLKAGLLPSIVPPGEDLGALRPAVLGETGLDPATRVTCVGSHDTASAVVGVPAENPDFAYISCGTWALVGVELDAPLLDAGSRDANFTNEIGVDGTVRYLRNVMGLWILRGCLASWKRAGGESDLSSLLAAAADLPPGGPTFDVDLPEFLPPGDMPARVAAACRRTGQRPPESRPELVRSVVESLALGLARTVREAAALTGRHVAVVHLVGGGARNALLCQLLADASDLPVIAGPVEATAIGNALVQARTHGALTGDLFTLRDLVRRTADVARYSPQREHCASQEDHASEVR